MRAGDPGDGFPRASRPRRHLLPVARDRGRSRHRSVGRPARRPRRARCIPSRPRDRGTAAPAPGARRRSSRSTITPDVPRSRRWTMPGRSSPPMPLRSEMWCSSALTSVPDGVTRAGMHDHARRLVDDDDVGILVKDLERHRLGFGGSGRGRREGRRQCDLPSRTARFGLRRRARRRARDRLRSASGSATANGRRGRRPEIDRGAVPRTQERPRIRAVSTNHAATLRRRGTRCGVSGLVRDSQISIAMASGARSSEMNCDVEMPKMTPRGSPRKNSMM